MNKCIAIIVSSFLSSFFAQAANIQELKNNYEAALAARKVVYAQFIRGLSFVPQIQLARAKLPEDGTPEILKSHHDLEVVVFTEARESLEELQKQGCKQAIRNNDMLLLEFYTAGCGITVGKEVYEEVQTEIYALPAGNLVNKKALDFCSQMLKTFTAFENR